MQGYKYKVAHKRADKDSWNASYRQQRKRLIGLLQSALQQLEKEELEDAAQQKGAPKRSKTKTPVGK
jgi:hypothetical protein